METALLSLEAASGGDGDEAINAIFRGAHTIKGSAGLFGLDHVVAFTHVAESLLDEVRAGRVTIDAPLVAMLLSCCDHMRTLVDEIAAGRMQPDPALQAQAAPILDALRSHLGDGHAAAPAPARTVAATGASTAWWHISVRFGQGVLRNGMDPMSFIRYLSTLGWIRRLVTLPDAMPPVDEMDPECCYLGFEIAFETNVDKAAIESVFEFVLDDCTLRILPVEHGDVQPAIVEAAVAKQRRSTDPAARERQSVRVDSDKLDRLIDLVGELIIAQAGASLVARRVADPQLHEAHSTLAALVQEVRDSALQLRMVKIGATFNRFQRVVHDVSREIGKHIELAVSGEDTELDKTVVEKIADPLTHLVRNAMDHGIEPAELRSARGKPARGTISLNAYHDAGSVVIEVGDDGGGLDRERILAKGIERGLVEAGKALSDAEIFNLIFEPGFSTFSWCRSSSSRSAWSTSRAATTTTSTCAAPCCR